MGGSRAFARISADGQTFESVHSRIDYPAEITPPGWSCGIGCRQRQPQQEGRMKPARAVVFLLLAVPILSWSQASDLDDALAEMGVRLDLPESAEMLPVEYQGEVEYQAAFRFPGAGYVVRISLVPQSALVRYSCNGDIEKYVPLFSMGLLAAIAKDNLPFCRMADLPGPTVKQEFGADRGLTALLKGGKSDFGKGFTYIAVALLYKVGRGIVVVSFLYNDSKDLETDSLEFSQAYYCFRFTDDGDPS